LAQVAPPGLQSHWPNPPLLLQLPLQHSLPCEQKSPGVPQQTPSTQA